MTREQYIKVAQCLREATQFEQDIEVVRALHHEADRYERFATECNKPKVSTEV